MKYTQYTTFTSYPRSSVKVNPNFNFALTTSGVSKFTPFLFFNTTLKNKPSRIHYTLQHNVDDIDDRGVIEVPADAETVIYQDEDGQYYEVDIGELEEYDGDDGDITYHSKAKSKGTSTLRHNKQRMLNIPPYLLTAALNRANVRSR